MPFADPQEHCTLFARLLQIANSSENTGAQYVIELSAMCIKIVLYFL